jgi:hypothetical protein
MIPAASAVVKTVIKIATSRFIAEAADGPAAEQVS